MRGLERLKKAKGFTLIELAIVLVIIGIILGAVLKAQDLISNARAKKFVNDAGRKWDVATWTYFDRRGRFPGDSDKNGIIGEDAGDDPKTDFTNANFINPPDSPVTFGSFSFYVFLGNDGAASPKNVIVICKSNDCTGTFTADELEFMRALDTAIDGVSDAGLGLVRSASGNLTVDDTKWRVSNAGTVNSTSGDWANTDKALVYYFDRKP